MKIEKLYKLPKYIASKRLKKLEKKHSNNLEEELKKIHWHDLII